MKIIAITGSVAGRKTRVALDYVIQEIAKHNHTIDTEIINIGDYDLQFSDGRSVDQYNSDTQYVINSIMEADALIVGTPTYQTSIPGALKNIFDLLPMHALVDKSAGIVVTAGSPKYFLMAEQQLKPILSYMGARIVQKYVFIEDCDFDGLEIKNDNILNRLRNLGDDVICSVEHRTWVQNHPMKKDQFPYNDK
ncbi:NAD(P)H-dependent oxidoreductase [Erysipelothrix rhusiopathiae]|uniref:Flavin reductase n=1 Tax=Erysipelothrix rhusiopathiae ATCC 19414 TaxID=525280 RepID=E7FWM5_ERYRH|nr:NADPH-dependent FMN reductase [Erysipelothrix rhusiopathiae]UPU38629.1 NAD(P)H-dependent oxidoreductase [Erysipelothrix sp. Poltava]EFY08751.1 flavin reductase [Erysipelothrix rhusiopathiae ATCC 19414]MCG4456597.1 NAD(P)H-dependent oxidoreductase [Erysipelothrix rhusiopathiae]MDE8226751.1 NAD(P)H-dependent oxidoreductase [Erysipelothrix rhusiopathiae]MDE8255975.1 NAD(P)H-dependent oxidoreductase [Erysipelothrix rhusiopathiae]